MIRQAPASALDLRVPLAEEETLAGEMQLQFAIKSRSTQGWGKFPSLVFTAARRLAIGGGSAVLPVYPGKLDLATTILLPSLTSGLTIKRSDWIGVVAFAAEVTSEQDPILGQVTFRGRYPAQPELGIVQVTKENSTRLRAFWGIILSPDAPVTPESFVAALNVVSGSRILPITDTSEQGFSLGGMRFYARDPLLTQHNYTVNPDMVSIVELCQVRRMQNYLERGYVHGFEEEGSLDVPIHVVSTAPRIGAADIESLMRDRLRQIFSGKVGPGSAMNRTVQNLAATANGSNPGFPGEAAGAPNGSVCLPNDQRISFSNQAIVDRLGCQRIANVANDGSGRPVITVALSTSAPVGTFFSANRLDHKIYSADGLEQSGSGSFTNAGSLIWTGDANSTIAPGQVAYVQPAIFYPAGSGFSIPMERIERWWLNNVELPANNLRVAASEDFDEYAEPVSGGEYFCVFGKERAAVHYLLRKVSVSSNASGVVQIPPDSRGCFAFIQGVEGLGSPDDPNRINRPVVSGLTPNTTYNALVYVAPRAADVWQFQMIYPEYQGTNEGSFINGATIVSRPLFFAHSQGGGTSVYQGEADTRLSPISMYLPSVNTGIPAHQLNTQIQMIGEPYPGPLTMREIPLLPAPSLALPTTGQTLSTLPVSLPQSRSLAFKITTGGQLMGFRTPALSTRGEYQAVVAFVIEKDGERRLLIITRNTAGGENCPLDSDQQTAFNTFRM